MTHSFDIATETVTIAVNGSEISLPLSDVSELVGVVFSARKSGYEAKRNARNEIAAARKAKIAEKKANRAKKSAERKSDRIKKLEKQLAELKKAA